MNRGFAFLLAIPIFFISIFTILQVQHIQEEQELYDEYVMSFAIDYATDAAAAELLEMSHVGTDYIDWGKMNTDPDVALRTFEDVLLTAYGLDINPNTRLMLEGTYIPIFCVAAYDGYYVYTPIENKADATNNLVSTPKLPYVLQKGDAYYNINLGKENCRELKNGKLTWMTNKVAGITEKECELLINGQVSDDLAARYQQYIYDTQPLYTGELPVVYLPQDMTTMTKVNAIEGPTVLAFIDNWDWGTVHEISSFSIGGARIETSRQVAAYYKNVTVGGVTKSVPYYAYADLLPEYTGSGTYAIKIENLYPSVVDAAKAGYHYDHEYMDK